MCDGYMTKDICNTAYAMVPTRYKYTGKIYWAKGQGVRRSTSRCLTPNSKKARRLKKMVLMFDHAMDVDCMSMRMLLWCRLAPVSQSMSDRERNMYSRARRSREGLHCRPQGCYRWPVHELGLGLGRQPTQPEWWGWTLRAWYRARL